MKPCHCFRTKKNDIKLKRKITPREPFILETTLSQRITYIIRIVVSTLAQASNSFNNQRIIISSSSSLPPPSVVVLNEFAYDTFCYYLSELQFFSFFLYFLFIILKRQIEVGKNYNKLSYLYAAPASDCWCGHERESVYKYIVDYIHTATTKKTTTIFIILIFFKSEWRAAYKFYCCLSCWHNTHAMSHILIHNLLYPTHTSTKIAAPYQLEIICVFYQEYLSLELYMCVSVSRSVVEPRVVMQKEKN